jgi:hypothetical protein
VNAIIGSVFTFSGDRHRNGLDGSRFHDNTYLQGGILTLEKLGEVHLECNPTARRSSEPADRRKSSFID